MAPSSTGGSMAPANFGAPPSGQIPILFNDHHVYAKPDVLKQGRVLAALVRGGTILIPLRSMFEQMGATVSYDPASKTVNVTKAGSDIKLTVGQSSVTINGESRPLDVPPMIYQGQVMVPIRVISETMGAYVQWVPDQRVVVVRYVTATPPPPATTPAPPTQTAPPTTATPPPATPAPAATVFADRYIVGDYIFSPKVYNEFSPGNTVKSGNYSVRGAAEFDLLNLPWMIAGDFRQYQYPHNSGAFAAGTPCNVAPPAGAMGDPGCVTVIGGSGQTFVPGFDAKDYDADARLGLRVAPPRIYVGVGYLWRTSNYGYPKQTAFGFGAEKLPDLNQPFSVYGSVWYYPNTKGPYTIGSGPQAGTSLALAYNVLKYQIGGTYNFGKSGIFVDFGFLGDRGTNKTNAPVDFSHAGPYLGLGIHF